MNILIISHMYPNDFNKNSGIFVHQQVKSLKNIYENVNIKVISPIPYTPYFLKFLSNKYCKYYEMERKIEYEGIEIYYPRAVLLPRNLNFLYSGRAFYNGMKNLIDDIYKEFKFDLIHAHVALPDGECAILLGEKFNVPVVTTIHGQDMNYTINLSEKYKNKVVTVLDKSEKAIFVSNKLKNVAEKYVKSNSNFKVISNGISLSDISNENNYDIKNEFKNKKYILIVGNLLKTKGIHYAIEAFAKIHDKYPEYVILIIGMGPEKENLMKLSKKMNIESKIIFKGALPHRTVMKYMKECDFFVLPSYSEGFGVVYIEAMSNGKAVIGCKGEGIEDVIDNYTDGILVSPHNIEELIENMEKLICDNNFKNKIEEKAQNKIKQYYTWDNNAINNYEVYEEVINQYYGGR